MVQVQLSTFPQRAIFHNFQNYRLEWQPGIEVRPAFCRRLRHFGWNLLYSARNTDQERHSMLRLYVENVSREAIYLGGHILCLPLQGLRSAPQWKSASAKTIC